MPTHINHPDPGACTLSIIARSSIQDAKEIQEARAQFPSGLFQPVGSYHFGLDALLLAAYALKQPGNLNSIAELGSGCGAALFALSLSRPDIQAMGFEREPELVAAANYNAFRLGLTNKTRFIETNIETPDPAWHGKFDLILANPPWHSGVLPSSRLRWRALTRTPDTFRIFCACARAYLTYHGRFCLIIPPGLLTELVAASQRVRFGLREVQTVSSYASQPAKRLLCLLQKDTSSDPRLPAPLVLHENIDFISHWTSAAKEFCPWLAPK